MRLTANDIAPTQCYIKGNIYWKGEHIYHIRDQQAYGVTRINPAKDKRWFCSEDYAQAAEWRQLL